MMIKQLVLADQIQVEATCGAHRKYYQSKLDQVWFSSILLTCTTYCLHLNLIHLHLTHCYGHNDVNLITGIVSIFVRWRINTLKKVLVVMDRKHAASSYLSSSMVLNKRCSYLSQQQRVHHALLLSISCSALLVARLPALLVSTKPALLLGFPLVVIILIYFRKNLYEFSENFYFYTKITPWQFC